MKKIFAYFLLTSLLAFNIFGKTLAFTPAPQASNWSPSIGFSTSNVYEILRLI